MSRAALAHRVITIAPGLKLFGAEGNRRRERYVNAFNFFRDEVDAWLFVVRFVGKLRFHSHVMLPPSLHNGLCDRWIFGCATRIAELGPK